MFKSLNLSEGIIKALEAKGFTIPTEIQNICIPLIAEGKDVFGRSQTGSGKTFAFGLPAIDKINEEIKGVQVLIMCPTRELALQVTDEIRKITEFTQGCKIVPIYGGADITRQITALKTAKIVVGTPGRLMDHIRRRTLKLDKISMVVLDEADEMLNMGFRDDIEEILKHAPKIRQTVMFSATMPPAIKTITREYMISPEYIELGLLNSTLEEIEQSFVRVARNSKKNALLELFRRLNPERVIIFCNTKRMVDDINALLNAEGFKSLALHGDMRQSERRKVMDSIKSHKISTLVATDVAARGIDIDDVEYIFNYDLPNDVEYYIHRIGRTGRAGKSGKAITLINTKDQLIQINEFKVATKSKIMEHTLSSSLESYEEINSDRIVKLGSGSRPRTNRPSPRPTNRTTGVRTDASPDARTGRDTRGYIRKPMQEAENKPARSNVRYGADGKPTEKYNRTSRPANSDRSSSNESGEVRSYDRPRANNRTDRPYDAAKRFERKPRENSDSESAPRAERSFENRGTEERKYDRKPSTRTNTPYGTASPNRFDRKPRVNSDSESTPRAERSFGTEERKYDRKPSTRSNTPYGTASPRRIDRNKATSDSDTSGLSVNIHYDLESSEKKPYSSRPSTYKGNSSARNGNSTGTKKFYNPTAADSTSGGEPKKYDRKPNPNFANNAEGAEKKPYPRRDSFSKGGRPTGGFNRTARPKSTRTD